MATSGDADQQFLHPDIARLLAFFVDENPLTPAEHQQFLQCDECTDRLSDRLLVELQKRQAPKT